MLKVGEKYYISRMGISVIIESEVICKNGLRKLNLRTEGSGIQFSIYEQILLRLL